MGHPMLPPFSIRHMYVTRAQRSERSLLNSDEGQRLDEWIMGYERTSARLVRLFNHPGFLQTQFILVQPWPTMMRMVGSKLRSGPTTQLLSLGTLTGVLADPQPHTTWATAPPGSSQISSATLLPARFLAHGHWWWTSLRLGLQLSDGFFMVCEGVFLLVLKVYIC